MPLTLITDFPVLGIHKLILTYFLDLEEYSFLYWEVGSIELLGKKMEDVTEKKMMFSA